MNSPNNPPNSSPPNLVTENTYPSCEDAEEEEKPPETNHQIYKGV